MALSFTQRHRVYVPHVIAMGRALPLTSAQRHHLCIVLRLRSGTEIVVFNGKDGVWQARLDVEQKGREGYVIPEFCLLPQPPASDVMYCFAPLKKARLDYMIQKAVEMGAGILQPVWTQHTCIGRLNTVRMRVYAEEACAQCAVFSVPEIRPILPLEQLLSAWPQEEKNRWLLVCDESARAESPWPHLMEIKQAGGGVAVLIGPEGGFAESERSLLRSKPFVRAISLGPRILRADTAAVAALAIVQMCCDFWEGQEEREEARKSPSVQREILRGA